MKPITFTGCLIILIVLSGITIFIIQHHPSHGANEAGDVLVKKLPLADIAFIRIESAASKVVLAKKENQWIVENRFGYRADFNKISNLVNKIQNTRISRVFPIRDDIRKRLSLNDPALKGLEDAEKGTRVILAGKAGEPLANILFGKARRLDGTGTPDSHYVLINNTQEVYMIDMPFASLATNPQDWMDLPIIEAPAKEIQKIECYEPGVNTPFCVFERENFDDEVAPKVRSGQQDFDKSVYERLVWAITYLPMEDVLAPLVDPSSIGLDDSIRLDYYLFNGMVYSIFPCAPCTEKTPCFVKIEVNYQDNPSVAPSNEGSIASKKLNDKLGQWIYKISAGHHGSLITNMGQLKK